MYIMLTFSLSETVDYSFAFYYADAPVQRRANVLYRT